MNADTIFLDHRESLTATIFRIVNCPYTAEDLAHEAYLRFINAIQTQDIAYPKPFLYQIGRNLALDYLRKERIRKRPDDFCEDGESDTLLDNLPSPQPTPERQVASEQEAAAMIELLARLPERRRQILVLHKFHHWPYERIAAHFGISRSAVEKNLRAALAHLLSESGNGA